MADMMTMTDEVNMVAETGSRSSGHFFRFLLNCSDNLIIKVYFSCPPCIPAIASGHAIFNFINEREALADKVLSEITTEEIMNKLGGLPPQRSFYAWMAVEALKSALMGRSPHSIKMEVR